MDHLHSRSGNVFNSTDDATEDFYNFIEYLAIEGISDLCYRVADFLALEEALWEPPGELGQVKGQKLENNEGNDDICHPQNRKGERAQTTTEHSTVRTSSNNHGKGEEGEQTERLLDGRER